MVKKILSSVIYSVKSEVYLEMLGRLCDVIGSAEYFSGSVVFKVGPTDCRLTVSVIVYRRVIRAPEGASYPVSDLVPVWWEFHTYEAGEELLNDFSFNEMKAFLL